MTNPHRVKSHLPGASNPPLDNLGVEAVNERTAMLTELDRDDEDGDEIGGSLGNYHQPLTADTAYHMRRMHAKHLPWWKRPSPWWLIMTIPVSSTALFVSLAPRIEIQTMLVCSVHKPDIFQHDSTQFCSPLTTTGCGVAPGVTAVTLMSPQGLKGTSALQPAEVDSLDILSGGVLEEGDQTPHTCASDPVVQAEVAKLTAVITMVTGVSTCLMSAWWGAFSDRYGRTFVLGIALFGVLFSDLNFIFTTLNSRWLPGGYWFLVLGSVVDGFLGGYIVESIATYAYISDTTTEAARTRFYSLGHGLMSTGMIFGPALGSLLVRLTGSSLAVFYVTAIVHFCYILLVRLVVPESLLDSEMTQSKIKYNELKQAARVDRRTFFDLAQRSLVFLRPLSIRGEGELVWSLTCIALAYGLTSTVMGSFTYKFLYITSTFDWGPEILGYWVAVVGMIRGAYLTFILPIIIKYLKSKLITPNLSTHNGPIRTPSTSSINLENQPILAQSPSSKRFTLRQHPISTNVTLGKAPSSSPAFDMAIAQFSALIDLVGYGIMVTMPSPLAFTSAALLGSFSAGFNPAVQSIALTVYIRSGGKESGELLGALSVVQTLCSKILGPPLYGLVYVESIATFPRAIFVVSAALAFLSFVLLMIVRIPSDKGLNTCDDEETES